MYVMYIINTEKNRKTLIDLGLLSDTLLDVSYIAVDVLKNHASYTSFVFTYPLFELQHVMNIMYLPTYEARVFYLLEEGIVDRFNPHLEKDIIAKYYQLKNSKN